MEAKTTTNLSQHLGWVWQSYLSFGKDSAAGILKDLSASLPTLVDPQECSNVTDDF
jgi:hypothetical protein